MNFVQTYVALQNHFDMRLAFTHEKYSIDFYRYLGVPPKLLSKMSGDVDYCLNRIQSFDDSKPASSSNGLIQQVASFDKKSRSEDFALELVSLRYLTDMAAPNNILLVDASGTGLSKRLSVESKPGVSEVISGSSSIQECIVSITTSNGQTIDFLPCGLVEPEHTHDTAQALTEELRDLKRHVVLHAPAISESQSTFGHFGKSIDYTYALFRFDTKLDIVKKYKALLDESSINYLLVGSRTPTLKPKPNEYTYLVPGLLDEVAGRTP